MSSAVTRARLYGKCAWIATASVTLAMTAHVRSCRSEDAPAIVAPARANEPLDSVKQEPLFGGWMWRQRLAAAGVTFNARFIGEWAANREGYAGSGWDYAQHVDLGAVLDLAKLGVADSGTVRIVLSDRVGKTLQSRTGAYIQNQAFYGQGQIARFDELSYERVFAGRLSFKGGFYSLGNDFGGLPYVCNFSNNGHCGHPLALVYGSGWMDSPTGQWGARVKWSSADGWYAQSGVYDVTPLRKQRGYGFDLGFPGTTTGYIAPFEVGYVHGTSPSDYAGTYKVGGYYDSSHAARLGAPDDRVDGRNGFYLQGAQQVWKPESDSVRGIALFAIANVADARTGLFRSYFEAGTSWRGMFAQRPDDIASFGWVRANINSRLRELQAQTGKALQTDEQLWELNYGVQLARWLLLRPTLQYVVRPGGYAVRPDSAVFVMHLQAVF